MGYMTVKARTDTYLSLCREPNRWSWAVLGCAVAMGCGAALCGSDFLLWKFLYITTTVYAGLLWMDGWEECELDKNKGEMKISRSSVLQRLFLGHTDEKSEVVNLDDIVGVRVDEEDVRYFGKSHIVVIVLNTGVTIGLTESYTFGNIEDHYRIADILRGFLELDMSGQFQDTDDYLGDGSSSDYSYEQVNTRDAESGDVSANAQESDENEASGDENEASGSDASPPYSE